MKGDMKAIFSFGRIIGGGSSKPVKTKNKQPIKKVPPKIPPPLPQRPQKPMKLVAKFAQIDQDQSHKELFFQTSKDLAHSRELFFLFFFHTKIHYLFLQVQSMAIETSSHISNNQSSTEKNNIMEEKNLDGFNKNQQKDDLDDILQEIDEIELNNNNTIQTDLEENENAQSLENQYESTNYHSQEDNTDEEGEELQKDENQKKLEILEKNLRQSLQMNPVEKELILEKNKHNIRKLKDLDKKLELSIQNFQIYKQDQKEEDLLTDKNENDHQYQEDEEKNNGEGEYY